MVLSFGATVAGLTSDKFTQAGPIPARMVQKKPAKANEVRQPAQPSGPWACEYCKTQNKAIHIFCANASCRRFRPGAVHAPSSGRGDSSAAGGKAAGKAGGAPPSPGSPSSGAGGKPDKPTLNAWQMRAKVAELKDLGLTSAAQELQREWEAEDAKARGELSTEERKRGLHNSLAKRSYRIIKLNETLDSINKELEEVQKRREDTVADLEKEQLACENERAEVALLEQAASRPLDPGDVPQVLFTLKEDSIKGNPELEAMVKAVEQAKLAFNNAVVQFQNKFKDVTAAAAESTAAAEGAPATKGTKRGAPGEDAPGDEAEEPMEVDIEDADKAAISSLAAELDLDPQDQNVQNKVWAMLQQGIQRRRQSKKSS